MKKIGIIFAMEEEINELLKYLKLKNKYEIFDLLFYEGLIYDIEVILVESGVGKVNSARTTQILIDNMQVDYIFNIGVAGGVSDSLNVLDIVIGSNLVQHDFDITAFHHEKGYISNVGENIQSNPDLIKKMKEIISKLPEANCKAKIGTIVSGDIFCTDVDLKNNIRKDFSADAIDMESAAIAQVCYLDNKPFIIIRSISDKPNGSNEITFEEFLELASKRCAMILERFIEK